MAARSARPLRTKDMNKSVGKPGKPEKPEKPEKPGKPGKPGKPMAATLALSMAYAMQCAMQSAMLCATLCAMLCAMVFAMLCAPPVAAYAAEGITLAPGQTEFSVVVTIPGATPAFAGADMDVVISDVGSGAGGSALAIKAASYPSGAIGNVSDPRADGGQTMYMVGFSSSNGQNQFSGDVAVGVTFEYTGTLPCEATVRNIRLHRFAGLSDGMPQYDSEALPLEYAYSVSAGDGGQPGDGDNNRPGGDGGPGGKDTTGGNGNPGGSDSDSGNGSAGAGGDGSMGGASGQEGGGGPGASEEGGAEGGAPPQQAGGATEQAAGSAFDDLDGYEWAFDAIGLLASRGIVKGDGEGRFMPGDNVTRADFVLMVARLVELKPERRASFTDLPDHPEYIDSIENAAGCGIVFGIGDGLFDPYADIERQDVIAIIYRLFDYLGFDVAPITGSTSAFRDAGDVSDYAVGAMSYMVGKGLIIGSDGELAPRRPMTRAEIAVFLFRMVQEFGL